MAEMKRTRMAMKGMTADGIGIEGGTRMAGMKRTRMGGMKGMAADGSEIEGGITDGRDERDGRGWE